MPEPPDLAAHYERIAIDRRLRLGRFLLAEAGLAPGQSVLELECGTGLLTDYIAHKVGLRGEALGLDPLPLRIAIAHQHGRPNMRFQVGDLGQLARFPDGSFDLIVMCGGLQRHADQLGRLRELLRLLKPGGRLGLALPSGEHPHPVALVLASVLARPDHVLAPSAETQPEYPLSGALLEQLLRAAGFKPLRMLPRPDARRYASAAAAIEDYQAELPGRFLAHLDEAVRAQVRAEVEHELEQLAGADGITYTGLDLCACAGKPGA